MSTIITLDPNNDRSQSLNQLGSYLYTTKAAGMHTVSCQVNMQPVSGITITIAQSGSASNSVTSATPAAAPTIVSTANAGSGAPATAIQSNIGQNNTQLAATYNCAIGDVLTITLASSTAIDTNINDFKATLNIRAGTV